MPPVVTHANSCPIPIWCNMRARTLVRRQAGTISGAENTPLLNRLFSARGITDDSQLDHSLSGMIEPDAMLGLDGAAQLLMAAVTGSQQILIVGDYDADGATSSALMVSVLREMGAESVNYLVPNRFDYGYGLTPEIVQAARQFEPDLIVTVDNGISSIEGVACARQLGMKVLITDHHLPGTELPLADAIVNPNQPGCAFASKALAGVGVAFYLLSMLRRRLRSADWFATKGIAEPNLADHLDLVALGTVADVVELDHNNRILVSEGVRRIRAGRARPGINALLRQSGAEVRDMTTRDLAFGVGPRLNAAGRLDDMSLGIECLLADVGRAEELALHLDGMNRDRKAIETEMRSQAEEALDTGIDATKVGVTLYRSSWHEGVIGIIASRIKDKIHRPVIAFADTSGEELKGSGRAIPGLHMRDVLDTIAAHNPGLVTKFGGHAMAAGLSLNARDLPRFAAAFDEEARRRLSETDLENVLLSDGEVDQQLDLALARAVTEAAPWGQGFPEPVFDGVFEVVDQRIVGERHLKLKLRPSEEQQILEAIAFNHPFLLETRKLRLAYRLDVNRFRGSESLQLIVECTDLEFPRGGR